MTKRCWTIAVGAVLLAAGCDLLGGDGGCSVKPCITNRLPEPAVQDFPRWSPDGKWILYYDHGLTRYDPETGLPEHDAGRRGLWVMTRKGEKRHQVLAGVSLYGDWFPSGDSIVFERGGQIYKAAFESGRVDTASIVRLSPDGRFFYPAISPDGNRVAYSNTIGDTVGIWISPTDGTKNKTYFGYGGDQAWFPNEERLLYGVNGNLYVEDLNHKYKTRVHSSPSDEKFGTDGLSVSSDGAQVTAAFNYQVRVMDADGSDMRKLTPMEDQWGSEPDWSPNGERIVYIGPEHTIWTMNADGSDKEQLTDRPEGPVGRDGTSQTRTRNTEVNAMSDP